MILIRLLALALVMVAFAGGVTAAQAQTDVSAGSRNGDRPECCWDADGPCDEDFAVGRTARERGVQRPVRLHRQVAVVGLQPDAAPWCTTRQIPGRRDLRGAERRVLGRRRWVADNPRCRTATPNVIGE